MTLQVHVRDYDGVLARRGRRRRVTWGAAFLPGRPLGCYLTCGFFSQVQLHTYKLLT